MEPQDDPMGEEAVDLWGAEDPPDDVEDPVVTQATRSSISASNPWVLYEAGIICAREENGELTKNSQIRREDHCSQGMEPSITTTLQKIALRRQSIGRADWEKLLLDRSFMPTLHQSLGDWTHVVLVEERRKDRGHENLSGHLSPTLDRLDARTS